MCLFYNAQLFEITGAAKGVFPHSQSSCHIAKVVLSLRHDSRQIPIASDAPPRHTSRGFLHWRFAYAGPGVRRTTFMGPASANLHKSGRTTKWRLPLKSFVSILDARHGTAVTVHRPATQRVTETRDGIQPRDAGHISAAVSLSSRSDQQPGGRR